MPEAVPSSVQALLAGRRRLLAESEALVFNLDKCGYASDLTVSRPCPRRPPLQKRCARRTPTW
jgi:hypothetical protein